MFRSEIVVFLEESVDKKMPRPIRNHNPGVVQYIIARSNGSKCLFHDTSDIKQYFLFLNHAAKIYWVDVIQYHALAESVHLLLKQKEVMGISKMIGYVTREYAKYFNQSTVSTTIIPLGIWLGPTQVTIKMSKFINKNLKHMLNLNQQSEHPIRLTETPVIPP